MTFQQDFEVGTDEDKIATQYKLRQSLGYPQKEYDTLDLLEKIEALHASNKRLMNWVIFLVMALCLALSHLFGS